MNIAPLRGRDTTWASIDELRKEAEATTSMKGRYHSQLAVMAAVRTGSFYQRYIKDASERVEVRTRVRSTKNGHHRYTVQGYEEKPPPQRALGPLPTSNPSNLDLLGSSPDSLCSHINHRFRGRFDGFLHPYLYVKLQRVRTTFSVFFLLTPSRRYSFVL